jgi:Raf kinase inhibitor-like YbhB/YbcL family protein
VSFNSFTLFLVPAVTTKHLSFLNFRDFISRQSIFFKSWMGEKRQMLHARRMLLALVCSAPFLVTPVLAAGMASLDLQSSAFVPGATIPTLYGCRDAGGADKSPPLAWRGAPENAKTFALVVRDPDAPGGSFVHWVLYNLPGNSAKLDADVPKTDTIAEGGNQGVNGFGNIGYQGPCPPPGKPHHYHFHLYALDDELKLKPDATADDVEQAATGHTLAEADLVGIFER